MVVVIFSIFSPYFIGFAENRSMLTPSLKSVVIHPRQAPRSGGMKQGAVEDSRRKKGASFKYGLVTTGRCSHERF